MIAKIVGRRSRHQRLVRALDFGKCEHINCRRKAVTKIAMLTTWGSRLTQVAVCRDHIAAARRPNAEMSHSAGSGAIKAPKGN